LPVDLAEGLFADISALGTRQLFMVADGEPFLHPRIFEIIRLAKKHGLCATITTNGTLINESRARRVIDSGLDCIHVSLWASSYETYPQHYPGTDPSNFHRVIDGLKALSSLKAETGARTPHITLLNPIDRFNYRDVDKMVLLATETGCNGMGFTPFKTIRGTLDHYALSAQEQLDFQRYMMALTKRLESLGFSHNINRYLARSNYHTFSQNLPCYVCWFHSRVKVDGAVLPCGRSTVTLGNLRNTRFADIWNSEAYRTERLKRLAPDSCRYLDETADCQVCSYVTDNQKIHRIFKHALPLRRRFGGRK